MGASNACIKSFGCCVRFAIGRRHSAKVILYAVHIFERRFAHDLHAVHARWRAFSMTPCRAVSLSAMQMGRALVTIIQIAAMLNVITGTLMGRRRLLVAAAARICSTGSPIMVSGRCCTRRLTTRPSTGRRRSQGRTAMRSTGLVSTAPSAAAPSAMTATAI